MATTVRPVLAAKALRARTATTSWDEASEDEREHFLQLAETALAADPRIGQYETALAGIGDKLRTLGHATPCPYNYRLPNNRSNCTCWQSYIRCHLPDPWRPAWDE